MEATKIPLVCLGWAAEYSLADLFLQDYLRSLTDDGQIRANKPVAKPLPCEMRASVQKCDLLRITKNCAVYLVAAFLGFARAREIAWIEADCPGRCL